MLCRKLAALTSLRHLHLHTCAVFVPKHLPRTHGAHAREYEHFPATTAAAGSPPSPPTPSLEASRSISVASRPHMQVPAALWLAPHTVGAYPYNEFVQIVSMSSTDESRVAGKGYAASTSSNANTSGSALSSAATICADPPMVTTEALHSGPLPFLPQLTHLALRESSDWSRLESTLRDFSMPLQPLTAFLLSGLSSLRALRRLEVDDNLQVRSLLVLFTATKGTHWGPRLTPKDGASASAPREGRGGRHLPSFLSFRRFKSCSPGAQKPRTT
jgi:hypothetical protein